VTEDVGEAQLVAVRDLMGTYLARAAEAQRRLEAASTGDEGPVFPPEPRSRPDDRDGPDAPPCPDPDEDELDGDPPDPGRAFDEEIADFIAWGVQVHEAARRERAANGGKLQGPPLRSRYTRAGMAQLFPRLCAANPHFYDSFAAQLDEE
jgi:hypothetical protein